MGQAAARPAFQDVSFAASSKFKGKAVRLEGELLRPPAKHKLPAVVLMHGCGGWLPPVRAALRKHARHLAQNGFITLNLDSFGPRRNAGGLVCMGAREASDAIGYLTEDACDALALLQSRTEVDAGNVFLMGQSLGAYVALRTAVLDRKGFARWPLSIRIALRFRIRRLSNPQLSYSPVRRTTGPRRSAAPSRKRSPERREQTSN
jgi:poly(3-hydroxybutyrate) depolymerase